MSQHTLRIAGLGTAVPAHSLTQAEAVALGQEVCCTTPEQARMLSVLYRLSGVQRRYSVVPHTMALDWVEPRAILNGGAAIAEKIQTAGPTTAERMELYRRHAPELAISAAERALLAADASPGEITHLVTVSCTGFSSPGVDLGLIDGLGLAPETQRVHVGFMGCHGAINGLRAAHGLGAIDPRHKILLCAVELCGLHYAFEWNPDRCVGNALFGDGAAAAVCDSAADERGWRMAATGSCLLPDSADAMTWTIGDNGFEMRLSARIPDLIVEHLRPWVVRWLASQGLTLEEVRSWAVHPGGPRVLTAVEQSLSLPPQATALSRRILAECGNMSSPTVLFILQSLQLADAPRPCVALAFGPGLCAEAALFR